MEERGTRGGEGEKGGSSKMEFAFLPQYQPGRVVVLLRDLTPISYYTNYLFSGDYMFAQYSSSSSLPLPTLLIPSLQVPVANHRIFLSFGAVVEDGYGVCYNPRQTEILFTVTSWHHCSETDSLLMASRLQSSLQEMRDMMVRAGRVAAKL